MLPLRAARLLARHRVLWGPAVAPALIHAVLLVCAIVLVVSYAGSVVAWLWTPPAGTTLTGTLLLALWYSLYGLIVVAALAVAYATTLLVSGIFASPFNDALSARAEALLEPAPTTHESADRLFWREALDALRSSAVILVLYLVVMGLVLLLNVLPVVGSVAATLVGTGVSAFFLALEFTDATLARHGYRLRDTLRRLRAHAGLTIGFGLSTSLLLWIPLVNVLCVPIAVVGGTALALALQATPRS